MSVEEKLAIHEMIARYAYAYDGQDAEGFAQVFTEDGVFEIFVPGQTGPSVRLRSRQGVREWAAERLEERAGRFTSRHYQSGVLFDGLTSESALTRTMVFVTHQDVTEAAPRPTVSGCITTSGARWIRDGGSRAASRMSTKSPDLQRSGACHDRDPER